MLPRGSLDRGVFAKYWAFFAKLVAIGVCVKVAEALCSGVQYFRKLSPLDGVVFRNVVRVRGLELVNRVLVLPVSGWGCVFLVNRVEDWLSLKLGFEQEGAEESEGWVELGITWVVLAVSGIIGGSSLVGLL